MLNFTRFAVAFACLAAVAGCGDSGPERTTCAGTVTLDGTPLEEGAIAFLPTGDTQGPSAGGEIVNGHYEVEDVVAGTNRVEIRGWKKTGRQLPKVDNFLGGGAAEEMIQIVPAKYNTLSEEIHRIGAKQHVLDFDLHSSPASG